MRLKLVVKGTGFSNMILISLLSQMIQVDQKYPIKKHEIPQCSLRAGLVRFYIVLIINKSHENTDANNEGNRLSMSCAASVTFSPAELHIKTHL